MDSLGQYRHVYLLFEDVLHSELSAKVISEGERIIYVGGLFHQFRLATIIYLVEYDMIPCVRSPLITSARA
jgi:hypothetical protein